MTPSTRLASTYVRAGAEVTYGQAALGYRQGAAVAQNRRKADA